MKAAVLRQVHRVPAADAAGLTLHARQARPAGPASGTVVLVHGATLASGVWDIAVPGYSMLDALAQAGFSAWAPDIRGYARSDRISEPAQAYATLHEAVADIRAAVTHACLTDAVDSVLLVGTSWGSITGARYASEHPHSVRALALIAPIYATRNPMWLTYLTDPVAPERLRVTFGATRTVCRDDLLRRWDPEIPHDDKSVQRDPDAFEALLRDAEQAEAPPSGETFRVPNGTLHDLFMAFSGRPLYDAACLRMPVLLARGEHDATATADDARLLMSRLAPGRARLHTVGNAGHFFSAERAAPEFQRLLVDFLEAQVDAAPQPTPPTVALPLDP